MCSCWTLSVNRVHSLHQPPDQKNSSCLVSVLAIRKICLENMIWDWWLEHQINKKIRKDRGAQIPRNTKGFGCASGFSPEFEGCLNFSNPTYAGHSNIGLCTWQIFQSRTPEVKIGWGSALHTLKLYSAASGFPSLFWGGWFIENISHQTLDFSFKINGDSVRCGASYFAPFPERRFIHQFYRAFYYVYHEPGILNEVSKRNMYTT